LFKVIIFWNNVIILNFVTVTKIKGQVTQKITFSTIYFILKFVDYFIKKKAGFIF